MMGTGSSFHMSCFPELSYAPISVRVHVLSDPLAWDTIFLTDPVLLCNDILCFGRDE